jgi:NitT/TauT family transport system substrate-binding protein
LAQEKLITIGFTNPTGAAALPFVMAEKKGFFKKEGVNAVTVTMQNAVVVNGVLSRNLDYGGTIANFIGAARGGLPVRIVMSLMDGSDHVLVSRADIKRIEDLKGKTIGISSFGGAPHNESVMILRKFGMNPDKDVTFLWRNPLHRPRERFDPCHDAGAAAQQGGARKRLQRIALFQ